MDNINEHVCLISEREMYTVRLQLSINWLEKKEKYEYENVRRQKDTMGADYSAILQFGKKKRRKSKKSLGLVTR